jgi:hypothetical protein
MRVGYDYNELDGFLAKQTNLIDLIVLYCNVTHVDDVASNCARCLDSPHLEGLPLSSFFCLYCRKYFRKIYCTT